MDLSTLFASVGVSAVVAFAAAGWLARTWLGARITGEVEHVYAQKMENLRAELNAKHEAALEKLRTMEALTSASARVRQDACQRVLAAVSPVAGLAFVAAATSDSDEKQDGSGLDNEITTEFSAAHERAGRAVLSEFLLIGSTTSLALLGFLGYADRLVSTLNIAPRGDPRRAEVVSKLWPMIHSIEKALPEFARLPSDTLFSQPDLADVFVSVGIWARNAGEIEIVNPGE